MNIELDKELDIKKVITEEDLQKITLEILTAFSHDQTLIKMFADRHK